MYTCLMTIYAKSVETNACVHKQFVYMHICIYIYICIAF